jgi:hypothetical protein
MTATGEMSARVAVEAVRAWLEASCIAQGVPVVVTDAAVLSQVAVLVSGRGGRRTRQAQRAPVPHPPRSEPPVGLHAGRVQAARTWSAGGDDGILQQGGDDGVLTVQIQVGPLSA